MLNDISKNDIYELPIELHKELISCRWNDFVNDYVNKDKVIIFECCFIQNPVTVSMIKNNCPKEFTMKYIATLANIIMKLEPILIYVEQQNISKSFEKAVHERPNEWFKGFKDYYTNQGYGLTNNLSGLDGVIKILEARKYLENDIFDSLNLAKYKVDNSDFSIDLIKEKINSIINGYF